MRIFAKSLRILAGVLLGATVLPMPSGAMMPPQVYRDARTNADHHIQIRVTRVTPPPNSDQGKCQIQGRVVRVFRGSIKVGARLNLELSCLGPAIGRPPIPYVPMVGGALYQSTSAVQRARFLEAFLSGQSPNIIHDQAIIIPDQSTTPRCPATNPNPRCPPVAIP